MKRFLHFTILFIISAYCLLLAYREQLGLYIHPRFFIWSSLASGVGIVVSTVGIAYELFQRKEKNSTKMPFELNTAILIVVVLLGLILPPKSLSSVTASQRSVDMNLLTQTSEEQQQIIYDFSKSTKSYNLGDWVASLNANPDPELYVNKEVSVEGFVYNPSYLELTENEFMVSRFFITCCAVDARPVGLQVEHQWKNTYKENDWVRISGRFAIQNGELIIKPTAIEKIDVPANPYIY